MGKFNNWKRWECALLFVYFAVLFSERTVSVARAFLNADYLAVSDLWLYAQIATTLSLIVFLFVGVLPLIDIVRGIFTNSALNYQRTAYAAAVLLVGGVIVTDYTVLWLQFVAYGGLWLAMLLRAWTAGTDRAGVTLVRLAVSYLYVLCFSMAIPVVVGNSVATVLEIVGSLVLVFAFAVMLDGYLSSGGTVNFNLPLILFLSATNIALIALAPSESTILMIFLILTAALWLIGRLLYGNHQLLSFYGYRHGKAYFEGWYFKLQKGEKVIAFIPSYHVERNGKKYAMLQVVSDQPFTLTYPISEFQASEDKLSARIGNCDFSEKGIVLNVDLCRHQLKGRIKFGQLTPLHNDIMGLFANLPMMKCKHGVVSMRHTISGQIEIDGKQYDFDGGMGYIEKDRGNSFPSAYYWTQGMDNNSSVMLAVASVPYFGITFTGHIGVALSGGREYRFATYNLSRVKKLSADEIIVVRGRRRLSVKVKSKNDKALAAPVCGSMTRTIHESPAATVQYGLTDCGIAIFSLTTPTAGYEVDIIK